MQIQDQLALFMSVIYSGQAHGNRQDAAAWLPIANGLPDLLNQLILSVDFVHKQL